MNLGTVGLLNYQLRFLMLQKAEMVMKIKKNYVEIIADIFLRKQMPHTKVLFGRWL